MFYLAYGSNMWPRRLEARLGFCRVLGQACVDGYALRFHKSGKDGSGKCDACRTGRDGDRLYGVVYEVSDDQKRALDHIEGIGYWSEQLTVRSAVGRIDAALYRAAPDFIDARLRPFCWYKALVLAGATSANLPADYLFQIASVIEHQDTDEIRAREHYALLRVT